MKRFGDFVVRSSTNMWLSASIVYALCVCPKNWDLQARLQPMAPIDFWQNSIPIFCVASFCTTKTGDSWGRLKKQAHTPHHFPLRGIFHIGNFYISNTQLPDHAPWFETFSFLVEGVLLAIIASFGLVGNILSFIILSTQAVHKTFHNLLLLLSIFDMVGNHQIFIWCQRRTFIWLDNFLFGKLHTYLPTPVPLQIGKQRYFSTELPNS